MNTFYLMMGPYSVLELESLCSLKNPNVFIKLFEVWDLNLTFLTLMLSINHQLF